ncbi:MAG: T9SS type A sorting domain-containing protein [Ignavibacteriaceae bacterium]
MKFKNILFKLLLLIFTGGLLSTALAQPSPSIPLLVYPLNKTYRVADTLTFTWRDTTGNSTSYQIEVTPDPTFYYVQIDSVGLADSSFTVHVPLSNGSPYYWRVRGINVRGKSSYTPPDTFYVSIDGRKGPQIPNPSWPVNGLDVYGDSTNITWHLSYADSSLVFDLSVASDSAFTRKVRNFTSLSSTTFLLDSLLSDSTYFWKVRSRDSIHPDTSKYSVFAKFHVSKSSTHPILAWPKHNGAVYQTIQTFSWYLNGVAPGITFDFILSRNSNLSAPDTTASGLSSRFLTYYHLRSGLTYYWRVISRITGNVDSSAIDTFYVVQSAGPVVPILSWPIHYGTIYSNVPTLVWYVNSTGIGLIYDVKYSLSIASLNSTTPFTTTNLYYGVVTPLKSNTTYYWQVRSKNGTDSSAYSLPDSFVVAAGSGNAVVPIPSWPLTGDSVFSNYPTFSWYLNIASAGLTYDIRYSNAVIGLNTATIYSAGGSNSYTAVTPFPIDTIYYWQVRSRSASDTSAFCSPVSFHLVAGSGNPIIPIPSWPIGGATVYPNPPILNWYLNASAHNLKYKVEYSTDSSFAGFTYVSGIDTNSYQIPSALALGTTYYWRVLSYNTVTTDSSGWSPIQSFVTASNLGPVAPHIGSPTDGVKLQVNNPMLTWYLPTVGKNLSYDIQYSLKSDFSNPETISNLSNTQEVISSLQPGELYYWRVRSKTTDGAASVYSSSGSFYATGITGIRNGQVPYSFEVQQNYPNPFNPSTQIKFSLPKESIVSIKIYNMLGQLIKTLVDERKAAGIYTVQWNGDNNFNQQVATGVYLYRVTAGENVAVKKMILLK